MRKRFLKIASILSCACVALGLAACKNEKENTDPPAEMSMEWVIADFETWETGLQLIRTGDSFGTIHWNKEGAYVKSGVGSARLSPLGGYRTGKVPLMFFPTSSELFDFDNSDFTDANNITFEFYNAEDTEVNVTVGLLTSIRTTNEWTTTAFSYQPLKPNAWTTVTYTVDTSSLSISNDVTDIPGVYVAFENARSRNESAAPEVYLDDVVLHRYETAPEIVDLVQVKDNDYLDFDESWSEHVVIVRDTDCMPKAEIVTASECLVGPAPQESETDTRTPLVAQSGEKVLKLTAPVGTAKKTFWPGVEFSAALLQQSVFGDMETSDYSCVTFSMDVFVNSEATGDEKNTLAQRFGISFKSASDRKSLQYAFYGEPYEWTTFSISMYDLYYDWQKKYPNNTELFDEPGQIQLVWGEFNEGGDREFYVDNMHFTITEKDATVAPMIEVAPFEREILIGDKVRLPSMQATDIYDLELPVTVSAQYKAGNGWTDVALDRGEIPLQHAGEYKLVVSATNSLGNTTTKEYPFRAVAELQTRGFATYDYQDEVDTIYVRDNACTRTWHESISIGGEMRNGVVQIATDNANQDGAGYIGFLFAETLMDKAAEEAWDYITIQMYIDAPVSEMSLCSWRDYLFRSVETKKWIEVKITKDMLNTGGSYVNDTGIVLSDKAFYSKFEDACALNGSLLFYTNTVKNTQATSQITYYIDQVSWGKNTNGAYGNGDDYSSDPYDESANDPFTK